MAAAMASPAAVAGSVGLVAIVEVVLILDDQSVGGTSTSEYGLAMIDSGKSVC